jgi:formylglycine-generating enzyme required for sulfatase activity
MIEAITQLLRACHDAGLALEPEELLDALWLAGRWPAPQRPRADVAPPSAPVVEPLPSTLSPASPLPPKERVAPQRFPVSKPLRAGSGARPGKAVRLPAGDRPLRIGGLLRALKPLRKLAPSPIDLEPDEEATVDLWCQWGVQAIVLRPRLEKVRSVCLVIDSGASMELWNEVTRAWRRALVGSGLFRSVREFRLDSDGAQPTVRPWSARPGLPKTTRRDGPDQTAKLPLGPEPLVLIFTDACSRAWWNGSAFRLAAAWARQASLGLIGLLPQTMWHRTAMSRCSFASLVRPAGGGPLYTLCLPGLGGIGDVIPVASVQEHSLATLALLLGESHREVKGGGLLIDEAELARHGVAPGPESIGAEERLDQFLGSASPTAAQLARLLSLFSPPSLKAMRLIRAAAGLAATSVQEAEVVLGGLLCIEPGRATGSSSWVYRFHEGVADLLRRSCERDDPEIQRFAERFRDYLRRRCNEMAGIAGAIPLESGDSTIRASEDGFLDIDEEALPMVLDDAEDLIASLHQVQDGEGAALRSSRLVDGRPRAEQPKVSDDTAIPTKPPDQARDSQGADVRSLAMEVSQTVPHFETPRETMAPPPEARSIPIDEVQFTVYHPKIIRPGAWYPMLAFTHLIDRRPAAPEAESDPIEQVRAQAERILGAQVKEFRDMSVDARQAVPREAEITLLPHVPGIEFNPQRRVFRWMKDVHREEFDLRAAAGLDGTTARGRLSAYLGAIVLAEVDLAFKVDSNYRPADHSGPHEEEHARPYRRISPAARVPEPATHFEAPREIVNSIGMKLTLIPAGEFMMGSPDFDPYASDDEKPQHRVRITRPFYLGVYPVTCGQFRRFIEATNYQTEAEKDGEGGLGWHAAADEWVRDPKFIWRSPGFDQTNDHPVVNVSWNDASAFCDWLSGQESQEYRLPTEAEWEYACRAGTTTRFFFGNDENALGQYAWYWENAKRQTHPVGEKKPNGFGLYDMNGNVWEWCADGYDADYYKQSSADDPRGPEVVAHRVRRGGGWRYGPHARSASRSWNAPGHRCSYLGFRLARGQSGR